MTEPLYVFYLYNRDTSLRTYLTDIVYPSAADLGNREFVHNVIDYVQNHLPAGAVLTYRRMHYDDLAEWAEVSVEIVASFSLTWRYEPLGVELATETFDLCVRSKENTPSQFLIGN